MSESKEWAEAFLVVFLLMTLMAVGGALGNLIGYRQGQIDYAQGKIKYRPVNQVVWEESR